jgi:hypothetical protein
MLPRLTRRTANRQSRLRSCCGRCTDHVSGRSGRGLTTHSSPACEEPTASTRAWCGERQRSRIPPRVSRGWSGPRGLLRPCRDRRELGTRDGSRGCCSRAPEVSPQTREARPRQQPADRGPSRANAAPSRLRQSPPRCKPYLLEHRNAGAGSLSQESARASVGVGGAGGTAAGSRRRHRARAARRRSRTASVRLGAHAHPSPTGGGGAGRAGHHGLTGTFAHGSGIVARFFGRRCMTTCVGLG